MLANVVTPVPANDAPEKSFVAPASPVFETRRRTPPLVVAPPNGVAVAASAAGTMTAASDDRRGCRDQSSHGLPSRRGPERARNQIDYATSLPDRAAAYDDPERNPYEVPATDETYAATSSICFSESCPLNGGMAPLPFVTRWTTRVAGGFA